MSNCSFIAAIAVAGVVLHVDSEAELLLTKDTTHTLRIPTLFVQRFARCSLTSNLTDGFLLWSASLHLFAVTGTVEKKSMKKPAHEAWAGLRKQLKFLSVVAPNREDMVDARHATAAWSGLVFLIGLDSFGSTKTRLALKKQICEVVTFKTDIYRHRSPHSAKIHEQKQGNLYIYFIYLYIF